MLYVENLCEFVRLMVENNEDGIFWTQNDEFVNTSNLIKTYCPSKRKEVFLIKDSGLVLKFMSYVSGFINRAFGNLCYDKKLSEYKNNYCIFSFEQSINKTVL